MYEMLGMFNSALVQYDELDAMFTQYIINSKSTSQFWLTIQYKKYLKYTHQLTSLLTQYSTKNQKSRTVNNSVKLYFFIDKCFK